MNEIKELVEFDKIAAAMFEIQDKGNFLPSTETKEGYEASKRFVLDITTPTRSSLDKAHKVAKAYWIAGGKGIDSKKNELMDLLVEIQKPHQDAYKAFDQKEKDKKVKFESDLDDKINIFHNYRQNSSGFSSNKITDMIQSCGEVDTQNGFYHRASEAFQARADALEFLNDALVAALGRESEAQAQAELHEKNRLAQIEIDKQQAAMLLQQKEMAAKQAELDRKENEIKEKEEAEANEKQRLINELDQKEKEKQLAIEREEYAKEQSEIAVKQAKQAEIALQEEQFRIEKEAVEKRESDKRHTTKVKNGILKVLLDNDISDKDAKIMITLAVENKLPNLVICY